MVLYNYWIKFMDKCDAGKTRIDHERTSWKATRQEAEDALNKDLAKLTDSSTTKWVVPVEFGIEEKDFGECIEFSGIIDDDGGYEYPEPRIGNVRLNEDICNKFYGLKVKVKIEFMEE